MGRGSAVSSWLALAAGIGAALLAFRANAAERVPARLVWDGSACGSADDFAARVMRRSRSIRFVPDGEEVAVRLSIQPSPSGGLDARVRIEAKGRAPITRRIQSPDCDDALDALALVVAIGVEGRPASAGRRPTRAARRLRAPAPPPPTKAPPAPPSEPPQPDATPADVTPAPAAALPSLMAAPVLTPSPFPPVTVPPSSAELADVDTDAAPPELASGGLVMSAGFAALVSVGITPEPLLGGAVWVSAEWERAGLWAPELVLDAAHQEGNDHDERRGEADFGLNALGLALCPLRLGGATIELRPCALGSLGRLESEGSQTYSPRGRTVSWSSFGAGLDLSAVFGILELRASFGAAMPSSRYSFRFGPECAGSACEADVFHRVAPLIWSGALGAGLTPR